MVNLPLVMHKRLAIQVTSICLQTSTQLPTYAIWKHTQLMWWNTSVQQIAWHSSSSALVNQQSPSATGHGLNWSRLSSAWKHTWDRCWRRRPTGVAWTGRGCHRLELAPKFTATVTWSWVKGAACRAQVCNSQPPPRLGRHRGRSTPQCPPPPPRTGRGQGRNTHALATTTAAVVLSQQLSRLNHQHAMPPPPPYPSLTTRRPLCLGFVSENGNGENERQRDSRQGALSHLIDMAIKTRPHGPF